MCRSGCRLARVPRTDPRLGRVPVVMVTAAAGLVRTAEHLRFDAVVEKPVELDGFVRPVGPSARQALSVAWARRHAR
jgi:hypothetical protein